MVSSGLSLSSLSFLPPYSHSSFSHGCASWSSFPPAHSTPSPPHTYTHLYLPKDEVDPWYGDFVLVVKLTCRLGILNLVAQDVAEGAGEAMKRGAQAAPQNPNACVQQCIKRGICSLWWTRNQSSTTGVRTTGVRG